MEIYEKTVKVLGPEVAKAKHLMRFVQNASTRFTDEVRQLAHPEKRKAFISETYLLTLAKLINMFATLDSLKNMKACINNDLACYKRYAVCYYTGPRQMILHITSGVRNSWCALIVAFLCLTGNYLFPVLCKFLTSRAEGILNRGNVDAFALEESQNLSIFFATNNSITAMLKKSLEEVSTY